MQNMLNKKFKHQGFSGIPRFLFNICLIPILICLNLPLLLLNIIYNRIKRLFVYNKK